MAYADLQKKRDHERLYRHAHRAERIAYAAAYYLAHRHELRAKRTAWRVANLSKCRSYNAAHRAANLDRVRAKNRVYAESHKEKMRAYRVAHREELRPINAAKQSMRRAKQLGNGGSHTAAQWRDKLELFAHLCAYCGRSGPLERDHKVPIVRGGTDDISNIVPACRSCNARKSRQTVPEFIAVKKAVGL